MSGQHCENFDVKREIVHCYSRNVDRCCKWSERAVEGDLMLSQESQRVFQNWLLFCFVLLYNKSLNDWSLGKEWILFPSNLNVSLDFVAGNIKILGKQNSLFPSGPVIKCLIFYASLELPLFANIIAFSDWIVLGKLLASFFTLQFYASCLRFG